MSLYYVELPDILSGAGVAVGVGPVNAGWETRARSTGGFAAPPLAVFWHHTASQTAIENDLSWQCHNCPDKPVGNMTIDRNGTVWPVAAGASNCAGKGGPASFSRGTIPLDSGNTKGWNIEVANNGIGEQWPVAQIDAYFASSNALNAYFGNHPTDVITHHEWAPTRKIDPARAEAVQGPWHPRSINSSGTWDLHDIRNECLARASHAPSPGPITPSTGEDMALLIKGDGSDTYWAWNGVTITGVPDLQWAQWGFEAGLYPSPSPTVYPQGFIDVLVESQQER